MKSSDLKVVAIILAIALFFTIVTSNAVSIASVVLLANGGGNVSDGAVSGNNTGDGSGNNNYTSTGNDGGGNSSIDSTPAGNNQTDNSQSSSDNNTPSSGDNNQSSNNSSSNNSSSNNNSTADSNAWDKTKVFNFYKDAAHNVKTTGAAGYNKIEFQALSNLNLTGVGTVDDFIVGLAGDYMTSEESAEPSINEKGSDEAKRRFPDCTLTDMSKVVSATKTDLSNGNYKIVIVMADEDTPKKDSSFLGQVTNSVLYWEDISKELANISAISNYENTVSVLYKAYTIEAEMTKDGNFVSLSHLASVDISINGAKVTFVTLNGKGAHLDNTCKYTDFKY